MSGSCTLCHNAPLILFSTIRRHGIMLSYMFFIVKNNECALTTKFVVSPAGK